MQDQFPLLPAFLRGQEIGIARDRNEVARERDELRRRKIAIEAMQSDVVVDPRHLTTALNPNASGRQLEDALAGIMASDSKSLLPTILSQRGMALKASRDDMNKGNIVTREEMEATLPKGMQLPDLPYMSESLWNNMRSQWEIDERDRLQRADVDRHRAEDEKNKTPKTPKEEPPWFKQHGYSNELNAQQDIENAISTRLYNTPLLDIDVEGVESLKGLSSADVQSRVRQVAGRVLQRMQTGTSATEALALEINNAKAKPYKKNGIRSGPDTPASFDPLPGQGPPAGAAKPAAAAKSAAAPPPATTAKPSVQAQQPAAADTAKAGGGDAVAKARKLIQADIEKGQINVPAIMKATGLSKLDVAKLIDEEYR